MIDIGTLRNTDLDVYKLNGDQIYSLNNCMDTLTSYEKEKIVLWVGAGVGMDAPSRLPSGKDLMDSIMINTCGKNVVENIYSIWCNVNKILENEDISLGIGPRLETVINEIKMIETRSDNQFKIMSGFKSFKQTPFNNNHRNIASLLAQGANVVTTNYDLCIQKAYESITGKKYEVTNNENGIVTYSDDEHSGVIHHIHGIAPEWQDIGVTLNTVKRGFTKSFRETLDFWMDNDYCFVFLGYSCSDSFDVNIYFQDRINKSISSIASGVFIQHNTLNAKIPKNAKRILKCFDCSSGYIVNTNELLIGLGNYRNVIKKDVAFNWEKRFFKHTNVDNNILKDLIIARLAYMLGINAEVLERGIMKRIESTNYPIKNLTYYHILQYMYKQQRKTKKYRRVINRTCGTEYKANEAQKKYERIAYWKLIRRYYLVSKNLKSIDNIIDDFNKARKNNKVIGWSISTPVNHHCQLIVGQVLKASLFRSNDYIFRELSKKTSNCLEVLNMIINLRLNQLEEINQLALALRLRSCIKAIMNFDEHDIDQDISEAMYYYAEVTSIDGICGSYIIKSTNKLFLFYHKKEYKYLLEAKALLLDAKEMARLSGSVKHMKSCNKMLRSLAIFLTKHRTLRFIKS